MKIKRLITLVFIISFAILSLIACAQDGFDKAKIIEPEKNVVSEVSGKKPELLSGQEIYKINCAKCHGENGKGTAKGISFLKGHALDHSEEEFIKQVTNGEKNEMPAFRNKLSEEEIRTVVKYVREVMQKDAEKDAGTHHQH